MRYLLPIVLTVLLLVTGPALAAVSTPHFRFVASDAGRPIALELSAIAETVLTEVATQLGVQNRPMDPILVRIVHGDAAMRDAMPRDHAIDWAAGVAFPDVGLVVLKVDQNTRFALNDIFRHEISHIVLGRAVDHRHLPLWFVEGVAVHQAGEQIMERWQKTAQASLTGSVLGLAGLENGFPADAALADLAYAHSTAFLSFVLDRYGWRAVRLIIARVRDGDGFHVAAARTFGRSIPELEAAWLEALRGSASWIPILTGTTVVWAVASALFLWSWLTKRREKQRRLAALAAAAPPELDDEFA